MPRNPLGRGTAQQVECDEARELAQMGVTSEPDGLKGAFLAEHYAEAVHGNKHTLIIATPGMPGNNATGLPPVKMNERRRRYSKRVQRP